jgi:predicted DNA-binding antitoxin AbrB/MazE fold protein
MKESQLDFFLNQPEKERKNYQIKKISFKLNAKGTSGSCDLELEINGYSKKLKLLVDAGSETGVWFKPGQKINLTEIEKAEIKNFVAQEFLKQRGQAVSAEEKPKSPKGRIKKVRRPDDGSTYFVNEGTGEVVPEE